MLLCAYTSLAWRKVAQRKAFLSTIGTNHKGLYEVHPDRNDLGLIRRYFDDIYVSRLAIERAAGESVLEEARTLFPECHDFIIIDVMPKDLSNLPGGMKDRWKNKKPLNMNGE